MTLYTDVAAVIVTYYPDDTLSEHLCFLANSLGVVIVVDNTPEKTNQDQLNDSAVIYVANNKNLGVAEALNIGIDKAFQLGAARVFLFDQDSRPTYSTLKNLIIAADRIESSQNVAVIGPAYFDTNMKRMAPFIQFRGFRCNRINAVGSQPIEADYLITSGSLLFKEAWLEIGKMDKNLFIDFVDIEWCLRARDQGWKVLGIPNCQMIHTLGDEPLMFFGKKLPMHSALRHYYYVRNAVLLLQRNYVPFAWKVHELIKLPIRIAIYSYFSENGYEHFKAMSLGLFHGLIGRSGER